MSKMSPYRTYALARLGAHLIAFAISLLAPPLTVDKTTYLQTPSVEVRMQLK